MQQVVERLQELRAAVGRPQRRHRLAVERQAVLVVVLVGAALSRVSRLLLVLDVAPEQVVERPQRIDLQVRQRIAIARRRARSGSAG